MSLFSAQTGWYKRTVYTGSRAMLFVTTTCYLCMCAFFVSYMMLSLTSCERNDYIYIYGKWNSNDDFVSTRENFPRLNKILFYFEPLRRYIVLISPAANFVKQFLAAVSVNYLNLLNLVLLRANKERRANAVHKSQSSSEKEHNNDKASQSVYVCTQWWFSLGALDVVVMI